MTKGRTGKSLEAQFLPDEFDTTNRYVSDSEEDGREGDVDDFDSDVEATREKKLDLQAEGYADPQLLEKMERERRSGRRQTGPKGCIADYKAFKKEQEKYREEKKKELVELAKRMTLSSGKTDEKNKKKEEEEDEFFSDEDAFMNDYRLRRIEEITNLYESKKRFGNYKEIDIDGYLTEIDDEDKNVFVCIHLYEPMLPACRQMNFCLAYFAKDFPKIKFRYILASKVSEKFGDGSGAGLPALLIYKGGELFHNLVDVKEEMGTEEFAIPELQQLFLRKDLINDHDMSLAYTERHDHDSDE